MSQEISCLNCLYSQVIAESGEEYNILDPHGNSITRTHQNTVMLCRANPPTAGFWPEVTKEDWCGKFEER